MRGSLTPSTNSVDRKVSDASFPLDLAVELVNAFLKKKLADDALNKMTSISLLL